MKPSWDKLMDEFKDSTSAVVADVDCTVEEELCGKVGVEGYPTIKYGDPNNLQDYQGGREFDEMLEFAKSNLGPTCGPKNLDLCSEEQKKEIETIQAMSDDDLKKGIEDKEAQIAGLEKKFGEDVESLQKQYEEMMKTKDAGIAEVKKSGLATLKMVCADRPSCVPPAPPPAPKGEGDEEPPPEGEEGEEPPPEGEEGEEPKEDEDKKDL